MYHNTTHLTGAELQDSTQKAETQTEKVLRFFKVHSGYKYPPSFVHNVIGGNSPLTSTRRALSDLTKKGELEKTEHKRVGAYGKPEYMWRLKQEEGQQTLNF